MYKLDVLDRMSSEIGFRGEALSDDNKKSNSGLFYQDVSPLVDIDTINDVQNDKDLTQGGLDTLLTRMREQAVQQVLNKVFQGQSDFVLSNNIYPKEKTFINTVPKYDRFVNLKLKPVQSGYVYSIPWIELSFDGDVTFDLYLYNSNKPNEAIKTKPVEAIGGESTIVELNWNISDSDTHKGGMFYLGYFDSDLGTVSAYKKDYDAASLRVVSPYFYVEPCRMEHDGSVINVKSSLETSESSGLNIGINVFNDFTELILNNKQMFWQAMQHQMHEIVLLKIKYSKRSNINQRLTADMIQFVDLELYGNKENKIDGVQTKLNREINNIKKSLFYVHKIKRGTLKP